MKVIRKLPILSIVFTLVCAAMGAVDLSQPQPRTLAWDYAETNDLETLSFKLFSSKTLDTPLVEWGMFTNVPATNLVLTTKNGTNTFSFAFMQVPAREFFVVKASSVFYGGDSDFSNVTNTPALPTSSRKLKIF